LHKKQDKSSYTDNIIEFIITEFARKNGLTIFYSDDIPEVPVIYWDPQKGGIEEFLEVFKNLKVENPIILWPRGVCLLVRGFFYCYLSPKEEQEGQDEEYEDLEPHEQSIPRPRIIVKDRYAKALSYPDALLKSDPKEIARWLASRFNGARNALSMMRPPYMGFYVIREYLSSKLGEEEPGIIAWELRKLPGSRVRELYDYIEKIYNELFSTASRERIQKITDTFEKCRNWFKQNNIRRPLKADMERCLAELGIELTWSNR
jgi:hypothetical protein